ncbi:MAG: c-type cytochrome [Alphaproteobacteria bacterium]|nr:c-type cytochrome [Alphaproteobacteria bacterium]MCB9695877.1 c-type cytochrome [Alphaproteobacteria bacterium]
MKRLSLLLAAAACNQAPPAELPSPVPVAAAAATSSSVAADRALPSTWPLTVPDASTIPDGELGDAIRRGQVLVTHTREELPDYVGDGLHCTSCHLQGGTVAKAGPWVGITGMFPMYRSRSASVITLEERINGCMTRSMNGKPLPVDGDDMTAIVAYMTWLSQGVPVGVPIEGRGFAKLKDAPTPDPAHGQELFAQKCAACHGAEGQGMDTPDGGYVYPALWGDRSFNIGAGMARLDTAAAFVRWNMPLGQGGTLTDQEAYDLAAFFTTQPRPDLPGKEHDWPKGGKPRDARY